MNVDNQNNESSNLQNNNTFNTWSFVWRFWVSYFIIGVIVNFGFIKTGLISNYSVGIIDTVILLVVAGIFWLYSMFFKNGVLFLLLGKKLKVPTLIWKQINLTIIITLVIVSLLNLVIFHYLAESSWQNFRYAKGLIILSIITLSSILIIQKYKKT